MSPDKLSLKLVPSSPNIMLPLHKDVVLFSSVSYRLSGNQGNCMCPSVMILNAVTLFSNTPRLCDAEFGGHHSSPHGTVVAGPQTQQCFFTCVSHLHEVSHHKWQFESTVKIRSFWGLGKVRSNYGKGLNPAVCWVAAVLHQCSPMQGSLCTEVSCRASLLEARAVWRDLGLTKNQTQGVKMRGESKPRGVATECSGRHRYVSWWCCLEDLSVSHMLWLFLFSFLSLLFFFSYGCFRQL